jgi:inhibitor of cysteine peptidase
MAESPAARTVRTRARLATRRMRGGCLVVALAAAALAGCSSTAWNDMRENPREYFNIVSPTLQTDARVDGQRVTLRRGQALVVRLEEDVTTGQRWQMVALPQGPLIAPVQHDVVTAAGADGTGRAGEAVFRMRAVASGTQPVVLEYRRPDEAAASKTVRFDIVVR